MITLTCDGCKTKFSTHAAWVKGYQRHYCSRKCKDSHHGALYHGKATGRWNGGRSTNKAGYILVMDKDHHHADKRGYVLEHVAVMSSAIGNAIPKGMVVHHLNEIKTDNRIENLVLMDANAHLALHAELRKREAKPCKACGTIFVPTYKAHVYCSRTCGGQGRKRKQIPCVVCGTDFWSPNNKHVCCSRRCGAIYGHRQRLLKVGLTTDTKTD